MQQGLESIPLLSVAEKKFLKRKQFMLQICNPGGIRDFGVRY